MPQVQLQPGVTFLSELYAQDAPDAVLLAEYPSSNSDETQLQNRSKYLIHDPLPPPNRALLKVLGPHHLMCGWGRYLPVASEIPPPPELIAHWQKHFGNAGCPIWLPLSLAASGETSTACAEQPQYITLFPHQALPPQQQCVDPDINYELHSKKVIEQIDCSQATVLDSITPPCIVKLSHGYAGLGNFIVRNQADLAKLQQQRNSLWPEAQWVVTDIIENITGDFGVQFYLRKDASVVWLGLTEQHFDAHQRWCGGTFSASLQHDLFDSLCGIVEPVGEYLHRHGYFGLVGVDILRDSAGRFFLVDVNPRLTGITPFLMASRIFARRDGLHEGVYQASQRFPGAIEQLLGAAENVPDAKVIVQSVFEQTSSAAELATTCHISVSSHSQDRNREVLDEIFNSEYSASSLRDNAVEHSRENK